ncbi:putative leucine aminopeptidase 2 [Diplocarpon rosae]|nr:putative leucine aminopeptidase 2 [Diplocarpon rosae]
MKLSCHAAVIATIASLSVAAAVEEEAKLSLDVPAVVEEQVKLPLVDSESLRQVIDSSALLDKVKTLQDIADASRDRNRFIGSPGHDSTVNYIVEQLEATGYYNVKRQKFVASYQRAWAWGNGAEFEAEPFIHSPPANVTSAVASVDHGGCTQGNYPAYVKGKIVVLSRGGCGYDTKVTLAKAAGAVAVIIHEKDGGDENVLLGELQNAQGDYIPTLGMSFKGAQDFLAATAEAPAGVQIEDTEVETENVIAETIGGDKNHVLMVGAHTDSSPKGPGINDNASGVVGILEVALQLAKFSTLNKVRFAFWSAQEQGLLGSKHYAKSLTLHDALILRLYLDFDQIASPNYIYENLDGDGSTFGLRGPWGSEDAERLFNDYFEELGISTEPAPLDGSRDTEPFRDLGIPVGGLSSGADGIKSQEQADRVGGTAGAPYDPNYRTAEDTLDNINRDVFFQMTKAIAHAVGTIGRTTKEGPPHFMAGFHHLDEDSD